MHNERIIVIFTCVVYKFLQNHLLSDFSKKYFMQNDCAQQAFMKKICLALSVILIVNLNAVAQVNVTNLLCENKINPQGLSVTQPRLSWQLTSLMRSVMQTAYEVAGAKTMRIILYNNYDFNAKTFLNRGGDVMEKQVVQKN